jgi:hypothetical protein
VLKLCLNLSSWYLLSVNWRLLEDGCTSCYICNVGLIDLTSCLRIKLGLIGGRIAYLSLVLFRAILVVIWALLLLLSDQILLWLLLLSNFNIRLTGDYEVVREVKLCFILNGFYKESIKELYCLIEICLVLNRSDLYS